MVICDTCLKDHYENPGSFVRATRECECCRETAECSDIPSSVLIPKIKAEPPKKKDVYIQRFIKEDGLPKNPGRYLTNQGWQDYCLENKLEAYGTEWWLELMPESKYLEGILPHESVDETFIEHEISYQHHGVARMAINKYKKFLLEKLNDKP